MKIEVKIDPRFKTYEGHEFWVRGPFSKYCLCHFEPEVETELRQKIENDVLEWLKNDEADSLLEMMFKDKNDKFIFSPMVHFSRAEIYIKHGRNCWEVWRIATSTAYEKMISYKVKEIGSNEYERIDMPNEICCQETCRGKDDPEYNKENGIWNLI